MLIINNSTVKQSHWIGNIHGHIICLTNTVIKFNVHVLVKVLIDTVTLALFQNKSYINEKT
jgi:hypothetical protein